MMVIVDGVLFFNSFFIILKQYFPDDAEFLRAQASLSILPVSIAVTQEKEKRMVCMLYVERFLRRF